MNAKFLLVSSAFLFTSTAAIAQENVLNVYNWSDYIAEDTLEKFTAETGIKVNYDVFDTNELLEAKLLAGNSGYDVVVPSGFFLERQIKAGLFQPLKKDELPNLKHMDPEVMQATQTFDPQNDHAVDYMWGTSGIGYNVGMIAERFGEDFEVTSFDMLFDPDLAGRLADCGIAIVDAPVDVYASALNYLGLDPQSESDADLQQVEDLLTSIAPYVRYYHASQYIDDLANGEICLAYGYSGDVFIAQYAAEEAEQGHEIAYVIPEEGALKWFDMFAIPADAPNPQAAHQFIDFMMRPDIAAANTNYVYYASGNLTALDMIEDEVKTDPSIYPTPEVAAKLFTINAHTPDYDERLNRSWTRVKTGK